MHGKKPHVKETERSMLRRAPKADRFIPMTDDEAFKDF